MKTVAACFLLLATSLASAQTQPLSHQDFWQYESSKKDMGIAVAWSIGFAGLGSIYAEWYTPGIVISSANALATSWIIIATQHGDDKEMRMAGAAIGLLHIADFIFAGNGVARYNRSLGKSLGIALLPVDGGIGLGLTIPL